MIKMYAVELYSNKDDSFIEQIDIYETESDAVDAIILFQKDPGFQNEVENCHFGMSCVECDEYYKEINSHRIEIDYSKSTID